MTIDSNNRVIMGGYTGSTRQFGVMRFAAGSISIDTANFNAAATDTTAGTFKFPIASTDDEVMKVVTDASNRIYLAGKSSNGTNFNFAVARVSTTGTLDTTFNSTGKKVTVITSKANNIAYSIRIDSIERILLGGTTTVGGYSQIALTRYWP